MKNKLLQSKGSYNRSNFPKPSSKERNYGIDLLRILAIFMVIMLHVLAQGGILKSLGTKPILGEAVWFVDIICYCAVNIFGLISGYVGYLNQRRLSKILLLWLQVILYNLISIVLVCLFWPGDFSLKYVVTNLFPLINNTNWYFSAYFVLFFFMPVLNSLIEKSEKTTANKVLLISIILFMFVESLQSVEAFGVLAGYSFVWLALLYEIGAYIKKYNPLAKVDAKWCVLGFLGCAVLTFLLRIGIELVTWKIFGTPSRGTKPMTYTSPIMVLQAVFALELFSKMKIRKSAAKVIAWFAPMTFGIYILHMLPAFYQYIIRDAFTFVSDHSILFTIGFSILISVAIFLCGSLIDWCRIRLFRLCKVNVLAQRVGEWTKKYFL